MTPEELRGLVAVAAGGLDLVVADLGTPALDALVLDLLPAGRLTLGPGAGARATPSGVDVTGPGTGPFAGMDVTARFTVVAGTPALTLRATGDRSWSFPQAFPVLAGTVFDLLRFDAPTLVLDPAAPVPIPELAPDDGRAVLAFTGTLVVDVADAATAVLAVLLAGADHDVVGQVVMSAPLTAGSWRSRAVPEILLYGPEGESYDLGLLTIEDLRYDIDASPEFDHARLDLDVTAAVLVTGTIPVTVGDEVRRIHISGEVGTGAEPGVLLGADLSEVTGMGLDALTALLGHAVDVPFDVPGTDVVELVGVRMLVTPTASPVVRYATATVRTREDWSLGGALTLEEVDLTFRVDRSTAGSQLSASVSGLVALGDSGTLELVADTATATMGGALRSDDPPLALREVWADVVGGSAAHLPADLVVTRFDSFVTLPRGGAALSWFADLRIGGDWLIGDGISVANIDAELAHDATGTRLHLSATFLAGGVEIEVAADYDPAPDRQWQFAGSTGTGQAIPVGTVLESLVERFGAVALPAPLAGLTVDDLGMEVTTGARRLFVTGTAQLSVDGVDVATTLTVDTTAATLAATLDLTVPAHDGTDVELVFDARFADSPTAQRFAAAWHHPPAAPLPRIAELVAAFSPAAAAHVPAGLALDLHDVALLVDRSAASTVAVLVVDLATSLDLAHLPLVGPHLTGATAVGFDPLRVVAASAPLSAAAVAAANALLPAALAPLPPGDLAAGVAVHGVLLLAGIETTLAAPVGGPAATSAAAAAAAAPGGAVWHQVQRSFGPLTVSRIGVAYHHGTLSVLVDAAVDLGGLTLSLDGLAAGLALTDPAAGPVFGLSGMGLDYAAGPIEAAGAFLAGTLEYDGVRYPAYGGSVVVRTPQLSLTALGSYVQLPAGPSLFVAAFLDYPIGGPPFFFVRGLAAAFGWNRRLVLPAVTDVPAFPLVADAVGGRPPGRTLGADLRRLDDALPPSVGDRFLAVGVHFTSFGMVDSVVLVALQFGHRFELDLLGLSTLTLPAPEVGAGAAGSTPIAQVQLALRASLVPDEGTLLVVAQLTSASYLLSHACHLRGGFAFAAWFSGAHAGDFVLTAGGYHPRFAPPAHYPTAPRIGFDWQVCPELAISGNAYFALTPGMIMAGGSLHAAWKDPRLSAWFDASMDLLVGWRPFHYEADLHVAIGVDYTFDAFGTHTISVHLGADVHLWGPEFGGSATLDLSVASVTVTFGAERVTTPDPVPWALLRAAVLPAVGAMLAVAASGDTHATTAADDPAHRPAPDPADLGVLDATGLVLRVTSAVPATSATRGIVPVALPTPAALTPFGVGPCARATGSVSSPLAITLTRGGTAVEDLFDYEPVTADLPAAVWGAALVPDAQAPSLVEGLLTGYAIRPRAAAVPGPGTRLTAAALVAATALHTADVAALTVPAPIRVRDADSATRQEAIMDSLARPQVAAARADLLATVLPDAVVDLDGFDVAALAEVPQVMAEVAAP